MRRALSVQLFLAVFGASLSCHNSTAPSAPPATVGGDYRADQFVTTGSSGQTNQIVAGSSLFIYLAGDGTVSGQLNMAASGGNPAFAADMTGTWTRSGNTITFSQAADTFVRNMTFALEPNMRNLSNIVRDGISWQLVGDQVISGTRIQIRLSYFVTIASILRAAHIYLNQRA